MNNPSQEAILINANAAQVLLQALDPRSEGSIFTTITYDQETYAALHRMVDAGIFREIRSVGLKLADGISAKDFECDVPMVTSPSGKTDLAVGDIRIRNHVLRVV